MTKTNVMRLLDAAKIPYRAEEYAVDENDLNGMHAAEGIGMPPEQIFKTLVARGEKRGFLVFCIPVCCELDLKKAAKAVGEKSVAMLPQKELLGLTGYVHGGCSPVGMKKQFPTVFHKTAEGLAQVAVSAGKIGYQVVCDPKDLMGLLRAGTADIIVE